MTGDNQNKISKKRQYLVSVLAISLVAFTCYPFSSFLDYRIVGYLLLISVSLMAMVFDILPVLLAAILSALLWDFLFILPHFTLLVGSTEDTILLSMYFIIAMVNAALTFKIRRIEKAAIMKEEKEHTLKLYNTLLNSLSHELRTPITTIIGATDNLQSENLEFTEKDKKELLGEIAKASFRLNQQVENLLNMSRLESGFIRPKNDWCDMSEVIYNTITRIEEDGIKQQIDVHIDADMPLVKTDKGMIEQILYNLLSNAGAYTPPGSRIKIATGYNTGMLTIIIEDNGGGFPEDELENVFNKFYRLKNTRTGGTGLGLSIVKGFTEALRGTVTLKNMAGGGAGFTVTVPVAISDIKKSAHE